MLTKEMHHFTLPDGRIRYPAGWNIHPYQFRDGRFLFLLRDQCLIRLIAPERMSASKLLWIPDSAKRQEYELYQGEVLACGPGQIRRKDGRLNPIEVKPGDRVLFYWAAMETRISVKMLGDDGEELRIVGEEYIQGCLYG